MKRLLTLLLLGGCGMTRVKVDPVQVQPIHITVDVNVREAPKQR